MAQTNLNFPSDPELQAVAMAYRWPGGIADLVTPRVPVGAPAFEWWLHDRSEELTLPDTRIGRKGQLNQVEFSAEKKTDSIIEYGLSSPVPQYDMLPGVRPSWYNPRARAVTGVMKLVELRREKRAADLYFNAATYPTGNKQTLSGTSQFTHADSRPVKLLLETMDNMVMRPNTFVFNEPGWTAFRRHPEVTGALVSAANGNTPITSSIGAMASEQAVKDLFQIENLFIGKSRINTANKGQTPALSRLWGNHLAMYYMDPDAFTPDANTITFGLTAQFADRIARSFLAEEMGLLGGEHVVAGEMLKELIIAPDLGYLFSNVV